MVVVDMRGRGIGGDVGKGGLGLREGEMKGVSCSSFLRFWVRGGSANTWVGVGV